MDRRAKVATCHGYQGGVEMTILIAGRSKEITMGSKVSQHISRDV